MCNICEQDGIDGGILLRRKDFANCAYGLIGHERARHDATDRGIERGKQGTDAERCGKVLTHEAIRVHEHHAEAHGYGFVGHGASCVAWARAG